ncbi:MAG: hypothetical protein GY703_09725 [Gammaproteobacteria bacterium]|nr:hypothetical protein [Gammaproteobacteria bacterium]
MRNTLVIQSHRHPLPYGWIEPCLESVRHWCKSNAWDYAFRGDEIFDCVPSRIRAKTRRQLVVATDLARLLILQEALDNGYDTVIWLDADFFIFDPDKFVLPETPYAVGREVWVQTHSNGKLKAYKKVHNAFLMFRQGNAFLEFYTETATRLLMQNQGTLPPQFIGPKLLTALHNVANLHVQEQAGMLSPLVIADIINGEGPALNLFNKRSQETITGANLCISSCEKNEVPEAMLEQLIDRLSAPCSYFN